MALMHVLAYSARTGRVVHAIEGPPRTMWRIFWTFARTRVLGDQHAVEYARVELLRGPFDDYSATPLFVALPHPSGTPALSDHRATASTRIRREFPGFDRWRSIPRANAITRTGLDGDLFT